jgi:hypothetical protein
MTWKKHGLVERKTLKGFSHASHPTAVRINEDTYLLAYCGRDKNQHSHIFFRTFTIKNGKIKLNNDTRLALAPGDPGSFDSHGVLSCNFVYDDSKLYLYYCGWLNIVGGMWHCDTGRAIVDVNSLTAEREFTGPILGRRADIPFFAVATTVLKEGDRWIAWYNRGLLWKKEQENWEAVYGIHVASSNDGVDWNCGEDLVIPFKDEHEHSFGRPTVINFSGHYLMWFSARGAAKNPYYKIGFALSTDGQTWNRIDDFSGIEASSTGWDSESICYPFVFEHKDVFYMLFNGNQYGLTGFGYATLDKPILKVHLERAFSSRGVQMDD